VIITGGSTLEDVLLPDEVFSPYLASRNVFIFNPEGETFYPEDGTTLPGQWEEKAKMPPTRTLTTYIPDNPDVPLPPEKQGIEVGRVTHNTVVLRDGRVLIIGGRWSQPAYYHGMEEVDMYDFSTNTWTSLSKLPSADSDGDIGYGGRAFPSVSLLASSEASSEETGEVLVFGGWVIKFVERYLGGVRYIFIQGPRVPRRSAFVLNPMTNQWRRVGDLNVRRSGSLTAPWPSYETATFAIAIGGRSITSLIPAAEVYDASTETWFLLPPEPELAPDDNQIRQGTSLTDGTVLTWSSVELGPQGKTSVKRLHPAGLDE
jgi:hypothetical protein